MRSNAGMANRQEDVDLRFAQVCTSQLGLWIGLAGLRQLGGRNWRICNKIYCP